MSGQGPTAVATLRKGTRRLPADRNGRVTIAHALSTHHLVTGFAIDASAVAHLASTRSRSQIRKLLAQTLPRSLTLTALREAID